MSRKIKLADILHTGEQQLLQQALDKANDAKEFEDDVLPKGDYIAKLAEGYFFEAPSTGNPGFKLVFDIVEGEHTDRRLWHSLWLTTKSMAWTKRDLKKFNITSLNQLDESLPQGYVCRLKVAKRKKDDGTMFNEVRRIDVLRIDPPEEEPFAPPAPTIDPDEGKLVIEPEAIVIEDEEFVKELIAMDSNAAKGGA